MSLASLDQAQRNVAVLVAAQALLGSQMPIAFILGGLSGQLLSPEKCLATLPITLIVLGSMLSATPISAIMQRHGRQTGFVIGALGGAAGGALCALALYLGSFALFLAGSLLSGIYMSAQGFYRFAATDTASEEFRPKAISWTMAGGLLAAVIGPQLVKLTGELTDPIPFAGGYLSIMVLNLVGVFIFAFLDIPKPPAPDRGTPYAGRSRLEMLRTPRIAVAIICGTVAYALMNLVMTSTPLAVVGCGFTTDNAADIVSVHVLAMFAPSFFTGHLIQRFGVERVIGAGLVSLAFAGAVGLAGVGLGNFYAALFLLGIGWNFGFVGATAMLTSCHSAEERGRLQGMNDLIVFGTVTLASFSSGMLMNCTGGDPVQGWTAVNIAMAPLLVLAGGALLWLGLRRLPDPA